MLSAITKAKNNFFQFITELFEDDWELQSSEIVMAGNSNYLEQEIWKNKKTGEGKKNSHKRWIGLTFNVKLRG